MSTRLSLVSAFTHLFFPHTCCGCGSDLLPEGTLFCVHCLAAMPFTGFEQYVGNPVENIFRGRAVIHAAAAHLYFTRHAAVQRSLHQFKYRGRKEIGRYFGKSMGLALKRAGRFSSCELVLPLPLHVSREKERGYNQAAVLAEGISELLQIPLVTGALERVSGTATQTHKNRVGRWQNMANKFRISDPALVAGKHVLLVDDVITTGSTMDACAQVLLSQEGLSLSIAALAYSVSA
jgi:ComF family protein